MPKFPRLSGRAAIDKRLLSLEQGSPQVTLILASVVAGTGYLLLAMFPLFTLIGVFTILSGIGSAATLSAWLQLGIWLLVTAICGLVTLSQLTIKVSTPSGLGLKEDKAPRLYELLAELKENYSYPRIKRVVLHDKFSLELIQVPRLGLPLLHTNVLHIGLPVLQGLSPSHFRGALAGLLGQHAAAQSRTTHWVFNCVKFFNQCRQATRRQRSAFYAPLKLFYRLYTPMLNYFSAAAVRQDILEGDIYMLEILNDTEVADTILRYEVCQAYLKIKFWPTIIAMLRNNPASQEAMPHMNMARALRSGLTDNEFAQVMKELINQETGWRDAKPCLHARLSNIGQTKLNMPPPIMETAANRYLGDAFSAVVKLLDKQWQVKYGKAASRSKKNSQPAIKRQAQEIPAGKPDSKTAASDEQTLPPVAGSLDPSSGFEVEEIEMHGTIQSENMYADNSSNVTISDRRRLSDLKQKSQTDTLIDNEAWELAYLTEKLEDKALAIQLYQEVLKLNPNHAKTVFAIGRILLSRNDASGVKVLERAMQLDKGCIAQACWMLAKYFKSTGDDARSRKYLERAANISAAA